MYDTSNPWPNHGPTEPYSHTSTMNCHCFNGKFRIHFSIGIFREIQRNQRYIGVPPFSQLGVPHINISNGRTMVKSNHDELWLNQQLGKHLRLTSNWGKLYVYTEMGWTVPSNLSLWVCDITRKSHHTYIYIHHITIIMNITRCEIYL